MNRDSALKFPAGLTDRRRIVVAVFVLAALLWFQAIVIWHDTAHAGHRHGPDLMCTLDILLPDYGAVRHETVRITASPLVVFESSLQSSNAKAALIPAYFCRAPPQSTYSVHR